MDSIKSLSNIELLSEIEDTLFGISNTVGSPSDEAYLQATLDTYVAEMIERGFATVGELIESVLPY